MAHVQNLFKVSPGIKEIVDERLLLLLLWEFAACYFEFEKDGRQVGGKEHSTLIIVLCVEDTRSKSTLLTLKMD